MVLQYLKVFYQFVNNKFQIYIAYLIEDGNHIGTRAELLIEELNPDDLVLAIISLIHDNLFMIKDLKFNFGNFTHLDMILDKNKFIEDIKRILYNIGSITADRAIQYLNTYLKIFEIIIDFESQRLPIHQRDKIADLLLKGFQINGFDLIVLDKEVMINCIFQDNSEYVDNSPINVLFQCGIPIGICCKHKDILEIKKEILI